MAVGGPADGMEVAVAPGPYRWIDARRCRGYAKPGPGRALYRRLGQRYVFQGVEAWQCRCGAVILARMDRCGLCGKRRRKAAVDG